MLPAPVVAPHVPVYVLWREAGGDIGFCYRAIYYAGWTSYVAGTLSIVYTTFLQHNAPFPTRDMRNGKLPISNLWQIALSLSLSKIQLILKRKP